MPSIQQHEETESFPALKERNWPRIQLLFLLSVYIRIWLMFAHTYSPCFSPSNFSLPATLQNHEHFMHVRNSLGAYNLVYLLLAFKTECILKEIMLLWLKSFVFIKGSTCHSFFYKKFVFASWKNKHPVSKQSFHQEQDITTIYFFAPKNMIISMVIVT